MSFRRVCSRQPSGRREVWTVDRWTEQDATGRQVNLQDMRAPLRCPLHPLPQNGFSDTGRQQIPLRAVCFTVFLAWLSCHMMYCKNKPRATRTRTRWGRLISYLVDHRLTNCLKPHSFNGSSGKTRSVCFFLGKVSGRVIGSFVWNSGLISSVILNDPKCLHRVLRDHSRSGRGYRMHTWMLESRF